MQVAEQNTASEAAGGLADFLRRRREQIAQRWADAALFRTVFTVARDEAVEASKAVVDALAQVARSGRLEDLAAPGFTAVREQLGRMSASRGRAGFTPAQIDSEVAGLRAPVIALLRAECDAPAEGPAHDCALALTALMGTLRLVVLEAIVEHGAAYAILDITGVPTVDSLVAQHLMKTVAAARLMGAECIVSGIRPAIAQTIVHLGIDLGTVVTRAGLADALTHALTEQGVVVSRHSLAGASPQ
ncbi:STAS domain-containing protein [Streptomyces sp. NPDC005799]|uniref:STAS domain-containing protein n=1 Tax=Streptomyces sp. NPDC005799 TaxID=3154678 RepID=UPI0034027B79